MATTMTKPERAAKDTRTIEAEPNEHARHKRLADQAGMKMKAFHGLVLEAWEIAPVELQAEARKRFERRRRTSQN